MWIKDWWNRMLKKFKKEESIPEAESVMELKPEEAPEPVPERKTSDEMIIEMAQSARKGHGRMAQTGRSAIRSAGRPEESAIRKRPVEPEEPEENCNPEESDRKTVRHGRAGIGTGSV